MEALATERKHWLDRQDLLVRAARHYEGAAQILIRHAVMTARQVRVYVITNQYSGLVRYNGPKCMPIFGIHEI